MQPSEFWRLDTDEMSELGRFMNKYQRAQEEANK